MITPDSIVLEKNTPVAVVGKRHNPQLGTYITGPYLGKIARVGKQSFSIKFDKESDNEYYPKIFDFAGFAKKHTHCVYGSMCYEVYSVSDTIRLLECLMERYNPESPKVREMKNAIDKLRAI